MCVLIMIYKPRAWTMDNTTNSKPTCNLAMANQCLDMKISDGRSLLL